MGWVRDRASLVAAYVSVLLVVAGVVGLFAFYGSRTGVAVPPSARWFADEVVYGYSTDPDGAPFAVSSQVGTRGLDAPGFLPLQSHLYVGGQVADHPGSQLWTAVTTIEYPDGNHLSAPEMFLASEDGVSQLVGLATVLLPVTFDPPLPVLPATVTAGARWAEEGTASYGALDLYDYRVRSEVLELSGHGCVVLRTTTTFTATSVAREQGVTDYDDTVRSTFCPGRWITASSSSTATSRPVTADRAREVLAGFAPAETIPPLTAAERREAAPHTVLLDREPASVGAADPVVLPRPQLVLDADVSTSTVTAQPWDRASAVPMWRLVGEGPTVVAPVVAGDVVVIADTAGRVTAVDAPTGFVLWQRDLGGLPLDLAVDDTAGYVAVLDRSGSVDLVDLDDGEDVTQVDAVDDPVGVALGAGEDGPLLVVADVSSVRGYDARGDEVFSADADVSSGPAVVDGRAYVGTVDGRVLSVDRDGTRDRYVGPVVVTDLVAGESSGQGLLALLDDRSHFRLLDAADLAERATRTDDARALSVGTGPEGDVFTTTALDGTITVYDADATVLRTVRAPITAADGGTGSAALRPAAVSVDGVVWASAPSGLHRWEAP